MMTQQITIFL